MTDRAMDNVLFGLFALQVVEMLLIAVLLLGNHFLLKRVEQLETEPPDDSPKKGNSRT